jgi:hypothetical protein
VGEVEGEVERRDPEPCRRVVTTVEGRGANAAPRGIIARIARLALTIVSPTQRLVWTREGGLYIFVWLVLLWMGLYQQINLILLVAGLAAGPVAASFFVSVRTLHRLKVSRRSPPFSFAGDPLVLDYTLENGRRRTAALALFVEDELAPADRSISNAPALTPRLFYSRVPGGARGSAGRGSALDEGNTASACSRSSPGPRSDSWSVA